MAWNEPNGQGPKDPWGNRQAPSRPPDLEEILANLSKQVKRLFGGSGSTPPASQPSGGGMWLGIAVVLVVWLAFDSIHIIDARERGVVLTFGEYSRTLQPGLGLTLPRPLQSVERVDVTQVRSADAQVKMLTRDENLVEINFAVQYNVGDPRAFLYAVANPEEALIQTAESAIRQIIGSKGLDDILVGNRQEISQQAKELMDRLLDAYGTGLEVSSVNLQEATVPQQVKEAFDDAIKAREDEQRIANEARAYESKVVPEARGEAARILQEAEGYRDSLIAKATGEADRFRQLAEQYRLAPDVTRRRLYLETMQEVLARSSKVLVDQEKSSNLMYLPLDKLMQPTPSPQNPRGGGQ